MIIPLAVIGFILSVYAIHVEKTKERIKNYKAFCDISDSISCTKTFSSEYGRILGIRNSVVGMFFYLILIILSLLGFNTIILYLSTLAFLSSIGLAFFQLKLKTFCLVCTGIYLVNILLLIFSLKFL
jgi:vitamin-K-epoxide reductase (warfarin-sensitive)